MDGLAETIAFERSLGLSEALDSGALLAYEMNGEPLPPRHGYPVRLVVPGKYAVASVKWLAGITVTDRPFDGFFQTTHYVYEWQRGGAVVREQVGAPRVRAMITAPADGGELGCGALTVRGIAWSGVARVARVAGDLRIRARAIDGAGRAQDDRAQPEWNRRGYGGNFIHEVTVRLR